MNDFEIRRGDDSGYQRLHLSVANGLELRDYFAGQALRSLGVDGDPILICERAYRFADAMLNARKADRS